MTDQTEQTEAIRQREVREGNLFDCPQRYYAAVKIVGARKMCAGFRMGVGGRGLSPYCSSCDNYAPSPAKCTEPESDTTRYLREQKRQIEVMEIRAKPRMMP